MKTTPQAASLSFVVAALLLWPTPPAHGAGRSLHVATWNLEWMVSPDTARDARIACRDDRRSALPCDVARAARDSADLARIAAHAHELDADVVAFQEVENAAIARRIFDGYRICITRGTGVQQVGFAVRPGIAHRCGPQLDTLSAGGRSRSGMALTLSLPDAPPVELLAVHLKSGCSRDALDSPSAACRLLSQQSLVLGEWIGQRTRSGAAFIVLGDFNRAGPVLPAEEFWRRLGPDAFVAAATLLPFRNCVIGAPYSAFIDHILVSRNLAALLPPQGVRQLLFRPADAVRYRLPDHCPLRVSLNFPPGL